LRGATNAQKQSDLSGFTKPARYVSIDIKQYQIMDPEQRIQEALIKINFLLRFLPYMAPDNLVVRDKVKEIRNTLKTPKNDK
jgi:hypothetical protein